MEVNMSIAIVVDSTAVAEELKKQYDNLFTVPLKLIFKDETYADGLDLTQEAFFSKLEQAQVLPTTSQPSIGEVESIFTDLLKSYDSIIYLTLSSQISGTFNSGMMARQLVSKEQIHVFDTLNASVIHLMMTEEALKMIREGFDPESIMKRLTELRDHARILLIVDDLKHLSRTGRLSTTSASIGNMLQIKPILHFNEGRIELFKKVRSVKKAHQTILDLVKNAEISSKDRLMIAQAKGRDNAECMKRALQEIYPEMVIEIKDLSPVISVHTGPNTIGVGWIKN
jgi:DegV family protein with EDD domain